MKMGMTSNDNDQEDKKDRRPKEESLVQSLPRRLRRLLHWGPLLNLFCIPYIWYTVVTWVIPWRTLFSSPDKDLLAITLILVTESYLFAFAVFRDPGYVPHNWCPDSFRTSARANLLKCHTCHIRKPQRSWHCRTCDRCVRQLDHHCPYINNCVGHGNQRAFLLYVVSTSFACLSTFAWVSWRLCFDPSVSPYELAKSAFFEHAVPDDFQLVPMLAMAFCCLIGAVTGALTFDLARAQVRNISRGVTTLESWSVPGYNEQRVAQGLEPVGSPFDLGLAENWSIFCGSSIAEWLVPASTTGGDGLTFRLKSGCRIFEFDRYLRERPSKRAALQAKSRTEEEAKEGEEKRAKQE